MTPSVRRLAAVAVSATAMTLLSSGLPLGAQEPKAPPTAETQSTSKTGRRAYDPARRVPMYFGQVGLSDSQREEIYKIQSKHLPKIAALEKQLSELRDQMIHECEGVLTPAQKQILAQHRASATEGRSLRRGAAVKSRP
jgi:hypothetical protein